MLVPQLKRFAAVGLAAGRLHLVISCDGCLQLTAAASTFPERSSSVASHSSAPTHQLWSGSGAAERYRSGADRPCGLSSQPSSDSSVVDALWEMFAARLTPVPIRPEKLQESEVKLKTLPSKSLMRCVCEGSSHYHCLDRLHSQRVDEPRTCRKELLLQKPQ